MIILVLCTIIFVLGFIKYVLHVLYMESYVKNMKSISPRMPLIGNTSLFMGKSLQIIYEEAMHVILRNETPIFAQIGPKYFFMVDNPDDIKTILTSSQCYDKPYIYDFFRLESGLISIRCKTCSLINNFNVRQFKLKINLSSFKRVSSGDHFEN